MGSIVACRGAGAGSERGGAARPRPPPLPLQSPPIAMAAPKFVLPPLPPPAPEGWGPGATVPPSLAGAPYAPFNKAERVGRIADFTPSGLKFGGEKVGGRRGGGRAAPPGRPAAGAGADAPLFPLQAGTNAATGSRARPSSTWRATRRWEGG